MFLGSAGASILKQSAALNITEGWRGGVVGRGCCPPNIIIIECTLVIVTEYNDTFKYKVATIYNQYINLRKIL